MTVLQRNTATGVDLGQMGRTLGKAVVIGAIVAGVVLAVSSNSEPQGSTSAQIEQVRADALVERFQNQFYAEANALNKADIGVPSASTAAPFLSGTSTPTHTGRTSGGATSSDDGDKADLIFKQKAAELTDPADRIHKQRAADLAE